MKALLAALLLVSGVAMAQAPEAPPCGEAGMIHNRLAS